MFQTISSNFRVELLEEIAEYTSLFEGLTELCMVIINTMPEDPSSLQTWSHEGFDILCGAIVSIILCYDIRKLKQKI